MWTFLRQNTKFSCLGEKKTQKNPPKPYNAAERSVFKVSSLRLFLVAPGGSDGWKEERDANKVWGVFFWQGGSITGLLRPQSITQIKQQILTVEQHSSSFLYTTHVCLCTVQCFVRRWSESQCDGPPLDVSPSAPAAWWQTASVGLSKTISCFVVVVC